jgi:hypothetical protein
VLILVYLQLLVLVLVHVQLLVQGLVAHPLALFLCLDRQQEEKED